MVPSENNEVQNTLVSWAGYIMGEIIFKSKNFLSYNSEQNST